MKKIIEYSRKGFVLVLALLTATILLALIVPYVSRVVTDYRLTAKIYNATAAINLAEAGIERALWEIKWGPNKSQFESTGYITGWSQSTDADANPISTSSNNIFQTSGMGPQTIGYYDVAVIKDQHFTYDLINKINKIYIIGTGYAPKKVNYDEKRKIKVAYIKNNFGKAIGASGTKGIELGKNSIVDSYNSDDGSYALTHTNSDGNIATNGPITIPKSSDVWGDANPGAAYPFSSAPTNVHGSWGTLQAPLVYYPIPQATLDGGIVSAQTVHLEPPVTDPPSYTLVGQNLTVLSGKTVNLSGGTYYFTSIKIENGAAVNVIGSSAIYVDGGNLSIEGHGALNTSATTAIYVNGGNLNVAVQGDMTITAKTTFYVDGGNIFIDTQGDINNTGAPKNLTIYSSGTSITLITQTDFFGAIYAPNADISLTSKTAGGEIYGAIACSSFVSGTNTGVHFDKALLNESPEFLPNGVISWQEVK